MKKIIVLGGGSWGTALANLLADKKLPVTLLVRRSEQAHEINTLHTNTRYLPNLPLHPALTATANPEEALQQSDVCVLANPCQTMRSTLIEYAPLFASCSAMVCASKGIEVENITRMSQIVAQELPHLASRYAVLSGPSFAQELVNGKPTAVALGCKDEALAKRLQALFAADYFRVYSTTDIIGVELGGAIKNVIAIAAGVGDGLNYGANSRAALITRGLAEVSRLGKALGARAETFMGLSGMGDLVLTCTTDLSRNRQVGMRLGQGETLGQIVASMHNIAEGVKTTHAVCSLGKNIGVELPIAEAMFRVLYEDAKPAVVVKELMGRALRNE